MRRTIPLLASLLWAMSCGAPDAPSPEVDEAAALPRALPPEGVVAAIDGVDIAYEARGAGETTLVFIHCWACDRTFWREQIESFAPRYEMVALDLPGHGESGANRDAWSIGGLAQDVRALVEGLDLERVVLIGHSMGGPVALMAVPLIRDRVVGVVLIDTVHDAEAVWTHEDAAQIIAAFEEDFEGATREFVPMMFPPDADAELVSWVAERANATDREAATALLGDFSNLDPARMLEEAQVPVRAVNAAALGTMIPETAIETNRRYADYDAAILEGVGHYLMLENPEEFNALLAAAIAEIEAP